MIDLGAPDCWAIAPTGMDFMSAFIERNGDWIYAFPHGGHENGRFRTIEEAHAYLIKHGSASPINAAGSLNEYQSLAKRTLAINPTKTPLSLEQCALELASEAGEAIGEIKRLNRLNSGSEYRAGKYTAEELRERIADEIGDVLWAVAAISTAINFPLAEIAEKNINKLRERVPAAFADSNNTPEQEG